MSNELIETILMEDALYRKHFVKKHSPKYDGCLWKIDSDILKRDHHVRDAIRWIAEYTRYPLIEDNFPLGVPNEDVPRNEWQEKLFKKFKFEFGDKIAGQVFDYFMKNKFSGNCYGKRLLSSVSLLNLFIGEDFPRLNEELKEVQKLIGSMGRNYSKYKQMMIGDRIDFVRKVEDKVYNVLWELRAD
ncbi:MAG: hypothetical protein AABW47_01150 [Nanoarchaeota archaeon]